MVVIGSILTFYNTLFDILYFRNGSTMNDSLVSLVNIISSRFMIKILKIIKKELDGEVTDDTILCTLINTLSRCLMKEDTAQTLIVSRKLIIEIFQFRTSLRKDHRKRLEAQESKHFADGLHPGNAHEHLP